MSETKSKTAVCAAGHTFTLTDRWCVPCGDTPTRRHAIPTTEIDLDKPHKHAGVALNFLGEDGEIAVAYGHLEPVAFVAAVTEYCRPENGEGYDPGDVEQVWMVRELDEFADEDNAEFWRWSGVTSETPLAFPATILDTEFPREVEAVSDADHADGQTTVEPPPQPCEPNCPNAAHWALETTRAEVVSGLIHACPADGSNAMPCCGRSPYEVRGDRMTLIASDVTCSGPAA